MATLQKYCVYVLHTEFASSENFLAQNVSESQTAEFTCVTTNSHAIISWTTTPNVGSVTPINSNQPSGGRRSVLKFVALAKHNHTTVRCIITSCHTEFYYSVNPTSWAASSARYNI